MDQRNSEINDGARQSGQRLEADHLAGDPFVAAVRGTRMPIIVTDPNVADNPIIFANQAFFKLTGYEPDEVIGRNCRFLQGPETRPEDVARLRDGIANGQNTYVEILNYRRDGTPFWNALFVSPVENEDGELLYFFGSQLDVTQKRENEGRLKVANAELSRARKLLEAQVDERTRALMDSLEAKTRLLTELDHRVKNNIQLMLTLLNIEVRARAEPAAKSALISVRERLQALGTVHRKIFNAEEVGRFDTGEFARDLVQELHGAAGRPDVRLEFDIDPVLVPAAKAAPLALLLSGLITGALREAYRDRKGMLRVGVKPLEGRFCFEITDHGYTTEEKNAVREDAGGPILTVLARQLAATVDWSPDDPMTLVRVSLPIGTSADAG